MYFAFMKTPSSAHPLENHFQFSKFCTFGVQNGLHLFIIPMRLNETLAGIVLF